MNLSTVAVRVALLEPHEQQWSPLEGAVRFGYYSQPEVASLSPTTGPVEGGTRIVVDGSYFARYAAGLPLPYNTTFDAPLQTDALRLPAPLPWPARLPAGAAAAAALAMAETNTLTTGALQRCVLGGTGEAAPAILNVSSQLCVSPPLAASGRVGLARRPLMAVLVTPRRSAAGASVCSGARVGGGILRFGDDMEAAASSVAYEEDWGAAPELYYKNSWGAAIIEPALAAPPVAAFEVTFDVSLARPNNAPEHSLAGGVCWSFAPIATLEEYVDESPYPADDDPLKLEQEARNQTYKWRADTLYTQWEIDKFPRVGVLDERGDDNGLAVRLHPSDGLTVAWRGEVVASGPPPGTNGWVPVLITCNGTHVNASVNGALLARDAPADIAAALAAANASEAARWRFALSGRRSGGEVHGLPTCSCARRRSFATRRSSCGRRPMASSLARPRRRSRTSRPRTSPQCRRRAGRSAAGRRSSSTAPTSRAATTTAAALEAAPSMRPTPRRWRRWRRRRRSTARSRRWRRLPASFFAAKWCPTNGTIGYHRCPRPNEVHATYDVALDAVRCVTPSLVGAATVELTVTLNGQQFCSHPLNLSIYGNPPDGGPVLVRPGRRRRRRRRRRRGRRGGGGGRGGRGGGGTRDGGAAWVEYKDRGARRHRGRGGRGDAAHDRVAGDPPSARAHARRHHRPAARHILRGRRRPALPLL